MITVLMATWQGKEYVGEQLESILAQTRAVDRIVISDDGSTDGTLEILQEYKDRYPQQIELINHGKDEYGSHLNGAAANFFYLLRRECSLESSSSDYWFLSDQDDIWMNDKVEKMVGKINEVQEGVESGSPILLYSDVKVVDGNKHILSDSLFAYQHMNPDRVEFSEVLVENPVTGGAAMFNQALLKLVAKTPASCIMHDWWLALAASCFGSIICLQEPLGYYRQHERNVMGAQRTGSLKDLIRRMNRSREVEENYRRMFEQGESFLLQYGGLMKDADRRTVQAFLSLRLRGPIRRFGTIRKHSLYKTSLVQTLAQCFTIRQGD